ncbi:hypothetical protein J0H58_28870 [bacterium]|nr:hypothetical protein [bacterium]
MSNQSDVDFEPVFPAFVVTFKDASGLVLAGGGDANPILPVFTDRDSANTFCERLGMPPHPILELPNAECLAILLSNPPCRSGKSKVDGVTFDPLPRLDGAPTGLTVYRIDRVIEKLKRMQ